MVPSVKKNSAVKRTDFRPMICENDAQDGWKTVEQSKKLVPAQKASIAVVPFRLVAMVLRENQHLFKNWISLSMF